MSELPPGFVLDEPVAPAGRSPTRITVTPKGGASLPEGFVLDEAPKIGVAQDVIQSAASGLVRFGAGVIGAPAAVGDALQGVERWMLGEDQETYGRRVQERMARAPLPDFLPAYQGTIKAFETGMGTKLHEPQTVPGEYARTLAEFVPGALMGPGGMLGNAVRYGVAPAVVSETAGQATKGTPYEAAARLAGGLGTAAGAAYLARPNTAGSMVAQATQGIDHAVLDAAEALMQQADAMGVRLTRAEAIQHVTGGATGLGDLQRVVEGSGRLTGFMAPRAQQVEGATLRQLDEIAPPNVNPKQIGPEIGTAASQTVDDVRKTINAAAAPHYKAAETIRLTPQEMAQVRASTPGLDEAIKAIRSDPQLNRYVANLPDDSVGLLGEVKKYLDQQAANAAANGPRQNLQRSAGYSSDARTVRDAARHSSPDYGTALAIEEQARRRYLEPLQRGYLGQLAKRDTTTRQAMEALFPRNPLPNTHEEIARTVGALVAKNSRAARDLVRVHIESVFNEAAQNLPSGMNQFGGAKFAAVLQGNAQQRENLAAAIRALPDGDARWQGLAKLLDVLEATGQRQPIGSKTSFNTQIQEQLRSGKFASEAAGVAATGGLGLPRRLIKVMDDWRQARNLDQLAAVLTDPKAAPVFRNLVAAKDGSSRSVFLIGQLLSLGASAKRSASSEERLSARAP